MESVKVAETWEVCESIGASPCLAEMHKGSFRTSYTKDNGSYRLLYIWNGKRDHWPYLSLPTPALALHAESMLSQIAANHRDSNYRAQSNFRFFFFFIVAMFLVCPTFKTQDAQFRVESRTRTSCLWWVVGFVVWGGHQNQWKRAGRMEEELWAVRFELRIATSMAGHTHSFSEVMIIHREEMQNREVKHFGRKWNLMGRHVYKGVYKYFSLLASLLFLYRS